MLSRLVEYVGLGLGNLLRYKLRSLLTVLGVVFGIAALMCMMAVGSGARGQIFREMERMGLRNVIVRSRKPEKETVESSSRTAQQRRRVLEYGVTFKDFERFRTALPGLVRALPVHELHSPVRIDGRRVNARVIGVTPDYFRTFAAELKDGRMLCALDSSGLRPVCLLGLPLPAEVARGRDVMGMHVSVGDTPFGVVGLVTPEARSVEDAPAVQAAGRVDIYVPYQTAIRRYGTRSMRFEQGQREAFQVEVDEAVLELEDPLGAAPAVHAILKKGHTREDYEVVVPLQMLRQKQRTQDIFNLVMVLISGLTLLVGGMGIVNIMLVSATERTKEIGIRRALGARRRDIMFQFLVETVALTLTGGLLGCAVGAAGVLAIARYTGWPVTITPGALFTSILVSAGAGVLFGLYPARKASRVNPVFALRCE